MIELKSFVVLATAATLASMAATAGDTGQESTRDLRAQHDALRLIDVWLESQQVYGRSPALSGAIVQGSDIVWSKGYGHLDSAQKIPATAQTLYSICSISKLFTSVALMQLWERGRVRLDEPITTYLPWARFSSTDQDSVPITLRSILSHSAGLPRDADFPYWTGPDFSFPTEEQLKASIAGQKTLWSASLWYQYSNLGLALVGDTVSAISGEPYNVYVQANILDPLRLSDTHPFMPMSLYNTRLAVGWSAITREGTRELMKPFDTLAMTASAGYTSTVEDLGRFAAWQFRLLRTNRHELLNASTLREMQRVQFTDPGWQETRGLGFEVMRSGDQTYVEHDGDCPGYHSFLALRPATETAIILMSTGERPGAYVSAAFNILDKRQAWKFVAASDDKQLDLESYAGRYSAQPWKSEIAVVPWGGGLAILSLPSTNPADDVQLFKSEGNDKFRRIRADGSEADEVRFERDSSGSVVQFLEFSNPHQRLGAVSGL